MSFEAEQKFVDKLLNDAIYYIPRNQRRYVWNAQNWSDMFDDVELVADGIADSHFIGSIVLKNEGKEDSLSKYTVIDGQQRIITLTIFLTAIMFEFKKRNMMDDFGGTKKYLVAKDIKDRFREIVCPEYHLTLPKLVNSVLTMPQEEIAGLSMTAFSNLCLVSQTKDGAVISAFKFYSEKIQLLDDKKLLFVRDAIIGIGYVNIISSTDEDSYTIFEILNARGLDLEDHELLKNYIMRYLQPVERRDDAKKIWDEIEGDLGGYLQVFLRHYAIHKYNYNNDQKQGLTVYKSLQNATKGRNVDQLLDDLKCKSNYYKRIIEPQIQNKTEHEVFSFFKTKRFVLFRPLLLSLMHRLALENISAEKYDEVLEFLFNFFVCYKIIGQENSNMLNDTVCKYAYLIETQFSDTIIDECMDGLRSKLPTLDSFTNSFKNVGWSHHWPIYEDSKNKERCQLVLGLLEKYISGREININVTIEHILPDADSIENAQIGNLFYLEEPLNRRCDNKLLAKKYDIYDESELHCPRGFVRRYREKEFKPEQRTVFLARLMYNNVLGIPDKEV